MPNIDVELAEPNEHLGKLEAVADGIRERDRQLEVCARSHWLQNGRDLLTAKHLLGHGHFEPWCRKELGYSKSKGEKLMRAAEMFGPLLESRSVTDLPPPTLVYMLSAPSVPQEIRDTFVDRVLAGEKVGAELKKAIDAHRRQAGLEAARLCEVPAPHEKNEASQPQSAAAEQAIGSERHAARAAALALIQERIGNALPELMTLAIQAGSGSVFSCDVEQELHECARTMPAPPMFTESKVLTEGEIVGEANDAESISVADSSEAGARNKGDADQVKVSKPSPRAVASDPPSLGDIPTDPVTSTAGGGLGLYSNWKNRRCDRHGKPARVQAPPPTLPASQSEPALGREG